MFFPDIDHIRFSGSVRMYINMGYCKLGNVGILRTFCVPNHRTLRSYHYSNCNDDICVLHNHHELRKIHKNWKKMSNEGLLIHYKRKFEVSLHLINYDQTLELEI